MSDKNIIVDVAGKPATSEQPQEQPKVETTTTVKLWKGDKLTVAKPDGRSIDLVNCEIARAYRKGDTKWTYPGLKFEGFRTDVVETFLGAKLFAELVYGAFDAQLQRCWKDSQDEKGFIANLIDESDKNTPRLLSARIYKDMQDTKKAQMAEKDPVKKADLTAKVKELFVQWKEAVDNEMMADLG